MRESAIRVRPDAVREKSSRQKKIPGRNLGGDFLERALDSPPALGERAAGGAKGRHVVRRSLVLARTGDLTLLLPSTQERRGTTLFSSPKYRFRCSVLEYAPVELPLTSLSESFSSLQYYGIIKLYIRWRTADRRRIMACVSRSHICPS